MLSICQGMMLFSQIWKIHASHMQQCILIHSCTRNLLVNISSFPTNVWEGHYRRLYAHQRGRNESRVPVLNRVLIRFFFSWGLVAKGQSKGVLATADPLVPCRFWRLHHCLILPLRLQVNLFVQSVVHKLHGWQHVDVSTKRDPESGGS